MKQFKSNWHKMRELVILSINIIFIKDTLQQNERLRARLHYLNCSSGSLTVLDAELIKRKHVLNKEVKELLEDILNSKQGQSDFCFNIEVSAASLTRKQLNKGYMFLNNIRDVQFALDLRKGALYPIVDPESNIPDPVLNSLEYTAKHEGSLYKYFEINESDPLNGNIRY